MPCGDQVDLPLDLHTGPRKTYIHEHVDVKVWNSRYITPSQAYICTLAYYLMALCFLEDTKLNYFVCTLHLATGLMGQQIY